MDTVIGKNIKSNRLQNPFPGLRPFHPKEAHLFFGRDGQSEEILKNLAANKFAAILGASGTGKSSLIYCGLLPILHGGFLYNGRSKWRIAISRPGTGPVFNLAQSLAISFAGSTKETQEIETDALINQALLNRSAEGISNVINQYGLASDENVLILIDQFEELFRYQYSGKDKDALDKVEHFVNLLVNIVKQKELPVYVVITMRSDFIGDCSPFQQFTSLINDSHYLIPRMTRNDFRKAIVGPVSVAGGKISDQLVQLLLNEMGNNPDHLPILQHALMRTWEYWIKLSDPSVPIGITEYEAIGRLDQALSNHANDAFYELSADERKTCEVVFKSLTEKGADNKGIRRPTSVKELAVIAETTVEEVIHVVEVFRGKGRTFLTPLPEIKLNENSIVDISHESLMRVWDKLKIWVDEESNAVKMYIRLAESADLYSEGKANLWGPPDLQLALSWREKQNPNLAWAVRFHPAFERTMVYLRTSEEEYIAEEENKIRLQKRAMRRSRIVALILGSAGMVSIGFGILALIQRQDAIQFGNEAIEQRALAVHQAEEAERQRAIAEQKEQEAFEQKDIADENRQLAERQRLIALQNLNEADRQRFIANQKEKDAQEQRMLALEQQKLAELASLEAERRRMLSIAQSMSVKSQQMRTDTLLKGLLAYQAFHLNKDYEGVPYNPDVFKALYSGISFFKGMEHNVYSKHSGMVRAFLQIDNRIFTAGSDGLISSLTIPFKDQSIILEGLSIVKKLIEFEEKIYALTINGIVQYDITSGKYNFYSNPLSEINDLIITDQGKFILIFDQSVSISDGFGMPSREIFRGEGKINTSVYQSSLARIYLAFANGYIAFLDIKNQAPLTQKQFASVPESNWGAIAFNSRKNLIAGGFGNDQGTVYLWDAVSGNQLSVLRGHIAQITRIAFSSDGSLMATASYDGTVRLWHLNDLNTLPIVFDDYVSWATSVTFTKDDKYIVSGGRNGKIRVYPVEITSIADDYCNFLTRELSREEWNNYVGEDLEYKPIKCKNQ